jgi:hypothetical protein
MRSRFARFAASAIILTLIIPSAALADTTPGPTPYDVYLITTGFTFSERGIQYSGIAQIEEERLSGYRSASLFFSGNGKSELCDGGTPADPSDDYVGFQQLSYSLDSATVTSLQVDASLASGSFEMATKGRFTTTNACTGEIIRSRPERHRFTLQLVAAGAVDTSETTTIVSNGDGSFSQVTDRFSFVNATGTGAIDRASVTLSESSLQHAELIVVPVP